MTALKRLVVAHQTGEDYLDDLLRAGVFVDLYAVIRRSVRVGQPSYSIKKLEPLYMGDQLRTGEVTNAADSIAEYAEYCAAVESGDATAAQTRRAGILDYNEVRLPVHAPTARLAGGAGRRLPDATDTRDQDASDSAAPEEADPADADEPAAYDALLEYADAGPGHKAGPHSSRQRPCCTRPRVSTDARTGRSGGRTSTGCRPRWTSGRSRARRWCWTTSRWCGTGTSRDASASRAGTCRSAVPRRRAPSCSTARSATRSTPSRFRSARIPVPRTRWARSRSGEQGAGRRRRGRPGAAPGHRVRR